MKSEQIKKDDTEVIDVNNSAVKEQLMILALQNIPKSSFAVALNVAIVAIVFWDSSNYIFLLSWLVFVISLLIFRNVQSKKYLSKDCSIDTKTKERNFTFFALITAFSISLGINYLLFYNNIAIKHSFLTMIVAGLSAGAVMSLSTHKRLVIAYLFILLVPFIVSIAIVEEHSYFFISILSALFLILLIAFAIKYNQGIVNLIISELNIKIAQSQKKMFEDNFYTIFQETPIGIFTYDSNLVIKQANQSLADILSISVKKLINLDMKKYLDNSVLSAIKIVFSNKKGYYEGEYTRINNDKIWLKLQSVPMSDGKKNIIGGLGIIEDITQMIKSQQTIHQQAFFDHLTGLANRLTLNDRLTKQIAHLKRNKHFGALLFIDLDYFKNINDSLGHNIGDLLLQSFSKKISKVVREEDTFARLGGDEFVILLSDLGDDINFAKKVANNFSKKLHKITQKPIKIQNYSLHLSLSIGIVILKPHNQDINNILKFADTAMYRAKQIGRNSTCFYEHFMSKNIDKELNLNNELYTAIKENQLVLYFQPIVDIKQNKITSCEALIRWNHPVRGLIMPNDFIPYAERSNLIVNIGDWVVDNVCQNISKLSLLIEDVAINISPAQFIQQDFIEKLLKTIKLYNIPPSFIKLELTESVAINNLNDTIEKMTELKSYGFKISMDDFGTGYSSLSYLKNLPFDIIKIDKSFILDVLQNEKNASLVKMILAISKQLNFKVIAEGVETYEQVKFLKDIECDYYQGYYKSKPLLLEQFITLLKI